MMGPSPDKILPMSSPRHLILPCLMLIVLVNKGANGNFVTPEVTSDLARWFKYIYYFTYHLPKHMFYGFCSSFIGCNSGRQISVVSVPDPGEGYSNSLCFPTQIWITNNNLFSAMTLWHKPPRKRPPCCWCTQDDRWQSGLKTYVFI